MEYLFAGFMTKFNASNSFKTAMGSRMYNTVAPAETLFPYAVFELVANTPDDTFGERGEEALIQIMIVSETQSVAEATDAFTKCKALYDWTTLTIANYTQVYCRRENAYLDRVDLHWQYVVEYRVLMELD